MRKKKTVPITIPIEIVELEDHSYHILVSVAINGIAGDMIIDTGASVTVADRQLFPNPPEPDEEIKIQSGSITGEINDVQVMHTESFQLGPVQLKKICIALIDLEYVNKMYKKHLNRKIIGLLGSDFCIRQGVIIDYPHLTLTISQLE